MYRKALIEADKMAQKQVMRQLREFSAKEEALRKRITELERALAAVPAPPLGITNGATGAERLGEESGGNAPGGQQLRITDGASAVEKGNGVNGGTGREQLSITAVRENNTTDGVRAGQQLVIAGGVGGLEALETEDGSIARGPSRAGERQPLENRALMSAGPERGGGTTAAGARLEPAVHAPNMRPAVVVNASAEPLVGTKNSAVAGLAVQSRERGAQGVAQSQSVGGPGREVLASGVNGARVLREAEEGGAEQQTASAVARTLSADGRGVLLEDEEMLAEILRDQMDGSEAHGAREGVPQGKETARPFENAPESARLNDVLLQAAGPAAFGERVDTAGLPGAPGNVNTPVQVRLEPPSQPPRENAALLGISAVAQSQPSRTSVIEVSSGIPVKSVVGGASDSAQGTSAAAGLVLGLPVVGVRPSDVQTGAAHPAGPFPSEVIGAHGAAVIHTQTASQAVRNAPGNVPASEEAATHTEVTEATREGGRVEPGVQGIGAQEMGRVSPSAGLGFGSDPGVDLPNPAGSSLPSANLVSANPVGLAGVVQGSVFKSAARHRRKLLMTYKGVKKPSKKETAAAAKKTDYVRQGDVAFVEAGLGGGSGPRTEGDGQPSVLNANSAGVEAGISGCDAGSALGTPFGQENTGTGAPSTLIGSATPTVVFPTELIAIPGTAVEAVRKDAAAVVQPIGGPSTAAGPSGPLTDAPGQGTSFGRPNSAPEEASAGVGTPTPAVQTTAAAGIKTRAPRKRKEGAEADGAAAKKRKKKAVGNSVAADGAGVSGQQGGESAAGGGPFTGAPGGGSWVGASGEGVIVGAFGGGESGVGASGGVSSGGALEGVSEEGITGGESEGGQMGGVSGGAAAEEGQTGGVGAAAGGGEKPKKKRVRKPDPRYYNPDGTKKPKEQRKPQAKTSE
jgi:hypothetical protein